MNTLYHLLRIASLAGGILLIPGYLRAQQTNFEITDAQEITYAGNSITYEVYMLRNGQRQPVSIKNNTITLNSAGAGDEKLVVTLSKVDFGPNTALGKLKLNINRADIRIGGGSLVVNNETKAKMSFPGDAQLLVFNISQPGYGQIEIPFAVTLGSSSLKTNPVRVMLRYTVIKEEAPAPGTTPAPQTSETPTPTPAPVVTTNFKSLNDNKLKAEIERLNKPGGSAYPFADLIAACDEAIIRNKTSISTFALKTRNDLYKREFDKVGNTPSALGKFLVNFPNESNPYHYDAKNKLKALEAEAFANASNAQDVNVLRGYISSFDRPGGFSLGNQSNLISINNRIAELEKAASPQAQNPVPESPQVVVAAPAASSSADAQQVCRDARSATNFKEKKARYEEYLTLVAPDAQDACAQEARAFLAFWQNRQDPVVTGEAVSYREGEGCTYLFFLRDVFTPVLESIESESSERGGVTYAFRGKDTLELTLPDNEDYTITLLDTLERRLELRISCIRVPEMKVTYSEPDAASFAFQVEGGKPPYYLQFLRDGDIVHEVLLLSAPGDTTLPRASFADVLDGTYQIVVTDSRRRFEDLEKEKSQNRQISIKGDNTSISLWMILLLPLLGGIGFLFYRNRSQAV